MTKLLRLNAIFYRLISYLIHIVYRASKTLCNQVIVFCHVSCILRSNLFVWMCIFIVYWNIEKRQARCSQGILQDISECSSVNKEPHVRKQTTWDFKRNNSIAQDLCDFCFPVAFVCEQTKTFSHTNPHTNDSYSTKRKSLFLSSIAASIVNTYFEKGCLPSSRKSDFFVRIQCRKLKEKLLTNVHYVIISFT